MLEHLLEPGTLPEVVMNILDLLILAGLAVGLARGFSTGVVRQVASFVGLLVAFVLSVRLMEPVGALVADSLGLSDRVAPLTGFVVVFIGVQVVLFAVVRMVETLLGALKLTAVNRVLGGVLGAAKAALVLSVVFLVLGYLGIPERPTKEASSLYRPVAAVLPTAWDYVSSHLPDVRRLSEKFGAEVEERVPERPRG